MERVFFNAKWFGDYLRQTRKAEGYKNTKQLSEAIEERTGVYIDFNSIDRYERGERMPGVDRFFAIIATLENEGIDSSFGTLCVPFYQCSLDGHIALERIEQRIYDLELDLEHSIEFGTQDYLLRAAETRLNDISSLLPSLEKLTLETETDEKKREDLRMRISDLMAKAKAHKRQVERGQITPNPPSRAFGIA